MSNTQYNQYAGQGVPGGDGVNSPLDALETPSITPSITLNGLLPKINKVFIEKTRIFGDPFGRDDIVRKTSDPLGAGIEIASFMNGATNSQRPAGFAFPSGNVTMAEVVLWSNYAYNQNISIGDREVKKAMLTPEEVGSYAAEKLATPLKTQAQIHYQSWKMLLSDVISGTRSIVSTVNSDGSGGASTYSVTITNPYCAPGMVMTPTSLGSALSIPAPVAGVQTKMEAADSLLLVQTLEAVQADFEFESTLTNAFGIANFCVEKPLLFMEKKTANALDVAFQNQASYKGFPTVSARDYIARFARLIEIDYFPELPTNASYTGLRLGAVMCDPMMLREHILYADVESMRDAQNRTTGYNFQGESIMGIYRGYPACAILASPTAD